MPFGSSPPDPGMPQPVFNALRAMAYDPSKEAFASGGLLYYLGLQRKNGGSSECGEWFFGTDAEIAENPLGRVSQLTYDVIHGGTYIPNGTIAYQGSNYRIRVTRNAQNSKQYGTAIVV